MSRPFRERSPEARSRNQLPTTRSGTAGSAVRVARPADIRPSGPFSRISHDAWTDHTSLGDVRPGQLLRIEGILFELVRNRCWELGVVEGAVFECLSTSADKVVLSDGEAGELEVEADVARFVSVAPLSSAA